MMGHHGAHSGRGCRKGAPVASMLERRPRQPLTQTVVAHRSRAKYRSGRAEEVEVVERYHDREGLSFKRVQLGGADQWGRIVHVPHVGPPRAKHLTDSEIAFVAPHHAKGQGELGKLRELRYLITRPDELLNLVAGLPQRLRLAINDD